MIRLELAKKIEQETDESELPENKDIKPEKALNTAGMTPEELNAEEERLQEVRRLLQQRIEVVLENLKRIGEAKFK